MFIVLQHPDVEKEVVTGLAGSWAMVTCRSGPLCVHYPYSQSICTSCRTNIHAHFSTPALAWPYHLLKWRHAMGSKLSQESFSFLEYTADSYTVSVLGAMHDVMKIHLCHIIWLLHRMGPQGASEYFHTWVTPLYNVRAPLPTITSRCSPGRRKMFSIRPWSVMNGVQLCSGSSVLTLVTIRVWYLAL